MRMVIVIDVTYFVEAKTLTEGANHTGFEANNINLWHIFLIKTLMQDACNMLSNLACFY